MKFLHLINKNTYNRKRHVLLIKNSVYFDAHYYMRQYPHTNWSQISPAEHYLTIGYKEGKDPSPFFSSQAYYNENPDVASVGMNPLLHYEKHGRNEGRSISATQQNNYSISMARNIYLYCTKFLGKMLYHTQIKKNQKARILVCVHLFYMEAWPIIQKYLENLSPYQYDLIVTYINTHHDEKTLDKIKAFKPNTIFHKYPNQGFDIGPFITVLQKINLDAYDIVFKIHSKGVNTAFRFVYNQIFKFDDWFYNLLDGILSGINCHKTIDTLLNNNKIGIIAAKNLIITDPKHKQTLTEQFAKQLHIDLPKNYHYIAGTMFALKSKCLMPTKNLHLQIHDFSETKRGTFSLAHAMERIICAQPEAQGYKILGLQTLHKHYWLEKYSWQRTSSLRLLEDKRFDLDADFFYKTLEFRRIKTYALKKIRIGDIKRRWIDGKLYTLNECAPFLYLTGNKKVYQDYCRVNSQTSKFDMSIKRFENLITSMKNGINTRQVPVIYGPQNILMDGQHRLCFLLHKYGVNYEVLCLHLDIDVHQNNKENKIE